MNIASVAEVKAKFSAYVKASEAGPVIVTRNGRPAAVIISVADGDELERLVLAYSPKFQTILNAGRKEIHETGGIAHEDFWRQVAEETQPME